MQTEYMIKKIDHFVITTAHLADCLEFYQKLGFHVDEQGGRYALFAGDFKINVHVSGHELTPHAKHVQTGSADVCFEVGGELLPLHKSLAKAGVGALSEIVIRHGVSGRMQSFYLNDPDGNLIELSCYD